MFITPILIAALVTPGSLDTTRAVPTLARQVQTHAIAVARSQDPAPKKVHKDHKWDGALAGALAGAGAGALTGLLIYGKGDGEWGSKGMVVAGTTFYGTLIGATTGLIIDLARK